MATQHIMHIHATGKTPCQKKRELSAIHQVCFLCSFMLSCSTWALCGRTGCYQSLSPGRRSGWALEKQKGAALSMERTALFLGWHGGGGRGKEVDPPLGCWDLARWPSLSGEGYIQSSLEGRSRIFPALGTGCSDVWKDPGCLSGSGLRH